MSSQHKARPALLKARALWVLLLLFSEHSGVFAYSNDYCAARTSVTAIRLSGLKLPESSLEQSGTVSETRRELHSRLTYSGTQSITGFDADYRYSSFQFSSDVSPMTNGHLHSISLPVSHWRSDDTSAVSFHLVPVLSVSSNVLKDPGLIDQDALQLWTGLIYSHTAGRDNAWFVGFRSDHRFGPYRAYPVAGYCWRPTARVQLQLAVPDFKIRYHDSNISISLSLAPEGNRWHVYNRDKTQSSDFFYSATVATISIAWSLNNSFSFELGISHQANREFSFVTADNTVLETDAESGTGIQFAAELRF
jgi:hypothetical protein